MGFDDIVNVCSIAIYYLVIPGNLRNSLWYKYCIQVKFKKKKKNHVLFPPSDIIISNAFIG